MNRNKQEYIQCFSLIELLLTLTIVMILLVIILPIYSSLMDSAKSMQCIAKLRALGETYIEFVQDHNGTLPFGYDPPERGGRGTYLTEIRPFGWNKSNTAPYLDCPATSVRGKGIYQKLPPDWASDYTHNLNVFINTKYYPRKYTEFLPATTIAAYDGYGRLIDRPSPITPEPTNSSNFAGFLQYSQAAQRHRGYINVLFLDLHVESMKEMPTDPFYWGSRPIYHPTN